MILERQIENEINHGNHSTYEVAGSTPLVRPILVTRNNVTIRGRGHQWSPHENFDALVIADARNFPDPHQHLVPNASSGRLAFRTNNYASLSFRGTPFDIGPNVETGPGGHRTDRKPTGYGTLKKFQVDLWVERNHPTWNGNYALAGIRGPNAGTPGPWYLEVWETGEVRLVWRDRAFGNQVVGCPLPSGNPMALIVSAGVHFDGETTHAYVRVNDDERSVSIPGVGFPYHNAGHAIIGPASDDGHPSNGPSTTYLGFRLSDDIVDIPSSPTEWFAPVRSTFFMLQMDNDPTEYRNFVRWNTGAAGASTVHVGSGMGFGLLVTKVSGEVRATGVSVRDMGFMLPGSAGYGSGVKALPHIRLHLRDLRMVGGSHGVYMPFGATNSYPTTIEGIHTEQNKYAGIQLEGSITTGRNWQIGYSGKFAIYIRGASLILDPPTFYAASQDFYNEPIENVLRADGADTVILRRVTPNFEGSAPRESYYRFSPSHEFSTRVFIEWCGSEKAEGVAGIVPAVLLVGSPPDGKTAKLRARGAFTDYSGVRVESENPKSWEVTDVES